MASPPPPDTRKPRLVLAEDDPDIRAIATFVLRRGGFEVTAVENGRDAVEVARQSPPDLIVLDWMMPELDGPAACAMLKADPATANVPVVYLTAKTERRELEAALALGAAGYVIKPFDPTALAESIRAFLT